MTFNVKKCQMALLDGSGAVIYTLYRVSLVVLDSFKYFGVFVSSNFRWDMHINDVTPRAYQRLGMIKRVLNKVKKLHI